MKILSIMVPLCLLSMLTKSQNRWILLANPDNKTFLFVDTVADDIEQDEKNAYYKSHAVTFWTMLYEKSLKNKKYVIKEHISKITVDTIKKRMQTSSMISYENNKVVDQDDSTIDWQDIIPGSLAEMFIKFGKSVNNKKIRKEIELYEYFHQGIYPKVN